MIYINEFVHFFGSEKNNWYYTISHGQIELTDTITVYDAEDYGDGRAFGEAPAGASYVLSDYGLDATELARNG